MQISERMRRVRFTPDVIRAAYASWQALLPEGHQIGFTYVTVQRGSTSYRFDDDEEWFAEVGADQTSEYHLLKQSGAFTLEIRHDSDGTTNVAIGAPKKAQAVSILNYLNERRSLCTLPPLPGPTVEAVAPVVFIGHGRSEDWRKVKDHLQDKHHYTVNAYEVGARAGHTIRDVLDEMLTTSSFAVLMMTAEDETGDGQLRARQNVVHEAGLFQGRLGFHRAIAVVVEGVEVFSNLDGVQQLRYPPGGVESTFGDILATLRREFGDSR